MLSAVVVGREATSAPTCAHEPLEAPHILSRPWLVTSFRLRMQQDDLVVTMLGAAPQTLFYGGCKQG